MTLADPARTIRVAVGAQRAVVRVGLEALVRSQSTFELVGSAPHFDGLAALIEEEAPDVALAAFDDSTPALECAQQGNPIVILADNPEATWIAEALRAGVRAVLPSQSSPEQIASALEAAAAGLAVIQLDDLNALLTQPSPVPASLPEPLTPREIEVLGLIAEGLSNKLIAAGLGISEHTVKFHVTSIMTKMNANSRTEAVTRGIRQGIVIL